MAGVDSTGYVQKTLTEIITSLQTGYRGVYGAASNVAARSRIGQRIALFAGALSEVWELGEAIFNATDPDAATGVGVDNLLKIIGLKRKDATSSTVILTLIGTATTPIPLGKRAAVNGTNAKFATDALATIAAVADWQAAHVYSLGQRAKNGGNVYQVITPGTSAGAGGPAGTGADIADNTVHWKYLGAGTGAIDAAATATVEGPVQGFAGTITIIDTPVAGWNNVVNLLDAHVGSNDEQDSEARTRRELSFAKNGMDTLESVRTEILALTGVSSCTIFENTTDATVDGIPPHAFECIVEGGVDQEIFDAIMRTRSGGIQPYGTTAGTSVDTEGNSHSVAFSRPTPINIYVQATLTFDAIVYPKNGDVQVQDTVALRGNAQKVGRDVVSSAIGAGIFQDVPGVFDVSQVLIGTVNPPVSAVPIVITPRQKAAFDSSRVTVLSGPGTF